MAYTIQQLQAFSEAKPELRYLTEQIIDYLEANTGGGGGGGLALESYQNSAMTDPVMAYVFKDETDAIYRVYEPIRNNDVSRNQFSYADSIDKFPFDYIEWYDDVFSDVKMIDIAATSKIYGSTMEDMVIDGGNNVFLIKSHTHKGNYGASSEIVIRGATISLVGCVCEFGSVLDSLGDNFALSDFKLESEASILCNSKTNVSISFGGLGQQALIDCREDGGIINDLKAETSSYILLGSGTFEFINCGVSVTLGNASNNDHWQGVSNVDIASGASLRPATNNDLTLSKCMFNIPGITVTIATNQADKNIIDVAGVAYEIGEDTGAATLTPV
jgi:hypothetical protein